MNQDEWDATIAEICGFPTFQSRQESRTLSARERWAGNDRQTVPRPTASVNGIRPIRSDLGVELHVTKRPYRTGMLT